MLHQDPAERVACENVCAVVRDAPDAEVINAADPKNWPGLSRFIKFTHHAGRETKTLLVEI